MISKKNIISVAVGVIILIAAGIVAYYYINSKPAPVVTKPFDYHDLITFEIKDNSLSESKKQEYTGRFEKIKILLNENPDAFNVWIELGSLHKLVNNYELAEKTWIYAGQLRPRNSITFSNLGDLYANFLKDYPKAEQAYLMAITNSEGELFNFNYTRQLFELYFYNWPEKKDYADDFLLERLSKYPDNPEILSMLSLYYNRTGNKEKAIEYYEKLLKVDPQNEAAKQELEQIKSVE